MLIVSAQMRRGTLRAFIHTSKAGVKNDLRLHSAHQRDPDGIPSWDLTPGYQIPFDLF